MRHFFLALITISSAFAYDSSPMMSFSYDGQRLLEARVVMAHNLGVTVRGKDGTSVDVPWEKVEKDFQLKSRAKVELAEWKKTSAEKPTGTTGASVGTEIRGRVIQTIKPGEILVQLYSLQAVPGSSGTVGAGGFVKRPQGWYPTDTSVLVLDYAKQFADGDMISIMATPGEIITKTSTDGAPFNFRSYKFVSEKAP
jgi:hypothetical protein